MFNAFLREPVIGSTPPDWATAELKKLSQGFTGSTQRICASTANRSPAIQPTTGRVPASTQAWARKFSESSEIPMRILHEIPRLASIARAANARIRQLGSRGRRRPTALIAQATWSSVCCGIWAASSSTTALIPGACNRRDSAGPPRFTRQVATASSAAASNNMNICRGPSLRRRLVNSSRDIGIRTGESAALRRSSGPETGRDQPCIVLRTRRIQ